ncbi:thioredoxin family protein [Pelotomaculum propionicicum]|uniref:thioredoxin family protein n=1 Tax=Pelotomaculum propionicicum TaxID=258475 RepID=UPI003B79B75C
MLVKVFMSCCGGDKVLDTVNEAVRLSGINAQVEAVKDFAEIARAGIISTPAIKIGSRVVASGRVPKVQDLVALLTKAAAKDA